MTRAKRIRNSCVYLLAGVVSLSYGIFLVATQQYQGVIQIAIGAIFSYLASVSFRLLYKMDRTSAASEADSPS